MTDVKGMLDAAERGDDEQLRARVMAGEDPNVTDEKLAAHSVPSSVLRNLFDVDYDELRKSGVTLHRRWD